MKLVLLNKFEGWRALLAAVPGWSLRRNKEGEEFVLIEVEGELLDHWCDLNPDQVERLPSPYASAARMPARLRAKLPPNGTAVTVQDALDDLGIRPATANIFRG